MSDRIDKFILGTAKLGIPNYGFSSPAKTDTSAELLESAAEMGVKVLDTSPRYGDVESRIGEFHRANGYRFRICTKVDDLVPGTSNVGDRVMEQIRRSLERTGVSQLDTVYLHQNDMAVIADPGVHEALLRAKAEGLVLHLGTSIYSEEEFVYSSESAVFDTIQFPFNLLDDRFLNLARRFTSPKRWIARSIYLQGVLLNPERAKRELEGMGGLWNEVADIRAACEENGWTVPAVATAFVAGEDVLSGYIVGTGNRANLARAWEYAGLRLPKSMIERLGAFRSAHREWTNPRNWRKKI